MGYSTYTCPISKRCGGCELLAVPYELQLKRKQKMMEDLFTEIAEADGVSVEPIVGMKHPLGYRHKAATPFAPGKRMKCGFYERGTHHIVFAKQCLVEAKGARKCLVDVANIADSLGIPAYNEDTQQGILRHAVIRMGYATKEALLTIVTNGERLPRAKRFAHEVMKRNGRLVGIVQNINTRNTNAILGNKCITLTGSSTMRDRLLGATFEISATSFYQTNPEQTEVLYDLALQGTDEAESIVDAYCGTGTIGICAAVRARKEGREAEVIGIERVDAAVGAARRNARVNDVEDSCRFVCADATEWMGRAQSRGFDALILDPPRAGSTPQFLEGVVHISPRRVAYVSCNPTTQVRDLALLRKGGYRVERICPVDLFPHTKHVETVVILTRAGKTL